MADILPFRKPDNNSDSDITRRKRCRHEWEIITAEEFGTDENDNVSHHRCKHCGAMKTVFRRPE